MEHVTLQSVHKRFGRVDVIQCMGLEIQEGEFLVLVGRFGCETTQGLRRIPRNSLAAIARAMVI